MKSGKTAQNCLGETSEGQQLACMGSASLLAIDYQYVQLKVSLEHWAAQDD